MVYYFYKATDDPSSYLNEFSDEQIRNFAEIYGLETRRNGILIEKQTLIDNIIDIDADDLEPQMSSPPSLPEGIGSEIQLVPTSERGGDTIDTTKNGNTQKSNFPNRSLAVMNSQCILLKDDKTVNELQQYLEETKDTKVDSKLEFMRLEEEPCLRVVYLAS